MTSLFPKQILSLLILLVIARGAAGMVVESGTSIVIDRPVYEDVYLTGGTITINAPLHGDLVVAAGTVYVNDSVMRDILVAGGRVTINGYVGGRIRCAGGTVQILRNVQGDLVIGGGTIEIGRGVTIFGNLLATGGDLTLNGIVQGDIKAAVGTFRLNGTAGRDLDCRGGNIDIEGRVEGGAIMAATSRLDIGGKAVFNGEVRYWSDGGKAVDFGGSLTKGKAIADAGLAIREGHWYFFGATSVWNVLVYLGMGLLSILLLQFFFAPIFSRAGDSVYAHMWKSLGMGFLFICGVPVLMVLAFISLIGIPLGLALLFGYILVWVFSGSITAVVAANWLNYREGPQVSFRRQIWTAFGMFIILRLLFFTPFLGWLLFLVLTCIAFGALLINFRWKRNGDN